MDRENFRGNVKKDEKKLLDNYRQNNLDDEEKTANKPQKDKKEEEEENKEIADVKVIEHKKDSKESGPPKIVKLGIIALIILATIAVFKLLPQSEIKRIVLESGKFAPLVYILMFTVLPIFFFPVPVLALAGGIAFGLIDGTIYTLIGAGMNCMIMFLLARYTARDYIKNLVERNLGETGKNILNSSERRGFFYIFLLRLIPLVPYNIINYGAGLTNMKFRDYMLASVLGIIPGTVVFLNLGDKSDNIYSKDFFIACVFMVLLIVLSTWGAKKWKK